MTSTAAYAGTKQYISFLNFVRSGKLPGIQGIEALLPARRQPLEVWLNHSSLFSIDRFRIVPSGDKGVPAQVNIKFRLSFQDKRAFVLARGLFEFSRPKNINISSDSRDRSFEMGLTENEAPAIETYLRAVQKRFYTEIEFKATLKKILRFEEAIKGEQEKFYEHLRACA